MLVSCLLTLNAQSRIEGLAGPVLGYVHDPAVEGIRAIWGISGASWMSQPFELG